MRGVPLPPLGSFENRVLEEMFQRDRQEKYEFAVLLSRLFYLAFGIKEESVVDVLEQYREEVFQLNYNSRYTPFRKLRQAEMRRKQMRDLELLKKVGNLSGGK